MDLLGRPRRVLETRLPELADQLAAHEPGAWESDRTSDHLAAFKASKAPGLLVPNDLGGMGASPADAVAVQRAIGALAPSLAVATTMHHFSVAALLELSDSGLESIMVEAIAAERLLVASGFAEGGPHDSIFHPTMVGTRKGGEVVLDGRKRPCSLSRSMDLLTVSAEIDGRLAVVLVPAGLPGICVSDYWQSDVLWATESGDVSLESVRVPDKLVSYSSDAGRHDLDGAQVGALAWFEILISASYLGCATELAARIVARRTDPASTALLAELEAAGWALEHVAERLAEPERSSDLLAAALMTRLTVEEAVARAGSEALRRLGGTALATDPTLPLLAATCHGLAHHPPRREVIWSALDNWLAGEVLDIGQGVGA